MNPTFERRLVFVQSVAISAALVILVLAGAAIAFAIHARGLQTSLNDMLSDVRAYVSVHGQPRDAAELANVIASRFFRPDVNVLILDPKTRAEVRARSQQTIRQQLTFVALDISPRTSSPSKRPLAPPASRFATGAASLFGLSQAQATFGDINVIIRPDDRVFGATIGRFVPSFGFALALAIVLGALLARFLAHQALRPLVDVTEALERFAAGDLSPQPIEANRKHQLGALAVAYNGAIAQMAHAFSERDRAQAAMKQFIADAGHQLRTPLTVIRGFIAVLRKGELRSPEDRDRILGTMNRQSLIMGSLIDKLILLDRWEQGTSNGACEPIDVSQLVEDVVSPIAEALPARDIRIDAGTAASARIDPGDLTHAVTNLVDNALKYTAGAVEVGVRAIGGTIWIEVRDQGPGMSPAELRHAFDRFYRGETRRDVDGSGLGLSIAKAAVERAGGTLTVESDARAGSRFTIMLPRRPAQPMTLQPTEVSIR